ncbi:MAG: hypothetical protein E7630_03740 [Ruminococcaceae bacterium]|nr:hypothetical protein [Oscillospiraceae bacterium]
MNKHDTVGYLSDIVNGLSDGKIETRWRHPQAYWKDKEKKQAKYLQTFFPFMRLGEKMILSF